MVSRSTSSPSGEIKVTSPTHPFRLKNVHTNPAQLILDSTQLLLLCLCHSSPARLKEVSTSTKYIDGLSTRLSASVDHIRFLGMIVGEAVSRKIDPEERRLSFKVPETEEASAERWRSLIDIDDQL